MKKKVTKFTFYYCDDSAKSEVLLLICVRKVPISALTSRIKKNFSETAQSLAVYKVFSLLQTKLSEITIILPGDNS